MLTKDETEKLFETIAELGGKSFKEEDIVYEGQKLVIPEQFRGQLGKAVEFIQKKQKEEEATANFSKTYNYRPWDGAVCAYRAMKKAYGLVAGKATWSFWEGLKPPQYITVATGSEVGEEEEVPWGQFEVPLLPDVQFNFRQHNDKELGAVFSITASGPRKHRFIIQGLFTLIEKELKEGSIYRGKAIDGQSMPKFLDLNMDTTKVVYSEQVETDLNTHIWSPMRYMEQHKKLGLPMKRAILLYGPFGTGKSLAGYKTAQVAQENKWTFIMARPGRDDFLEVMQTARLYQPACVFFEDAEIVTGAADRDVITEVLDTFDGIQSKGTSLMVVLTTNHPELIHKGMHRPGRVDAQIEISALDAAGIEKLIRLIIPENNLSPNVDWAAVAEANTDYVPAFVKEGADRSIRYAITRNNGDLTGLIDTQDLVASAEGLRPQFYRMVGAPETETDEKPLSRVIQDNTKIAIAQLAPGKGEEIAGDVWNEERIMEVQAELRR